MRGATYSLESFGSSATLFLGLRTISELHRGLKISVSNMKPKSISYSTSLLSKPNLAQWASVCTALYWAQYATGLVWLYYV